MKEASAAACVGRIRIFCRRQTYFHAEIGVM